MERPSFVLQDVSSTTKKRRGGLLLERRSLVVITQSLYQDMLHGICEKKQDTIDESIWNGKGRLGEVISRDRRYEDALFLWEYSCSESL